MLAQVQCPRDAGIVDSPGEQSGPRAHAGSAPPNGPGSTSGGSRRRRISWLAIRGEIDDSPRAAALMPSTICSIGASLTRYPHAPARQCLGDALLVGGHRQDQHSHERRRSRQSLSGGDSRHPRHAQVHQHDVGEQFADQSDPIRRQPGLANTTIPRSSRSRDQSTAKQFVVIDDHHARVVVHHGGSALTGASAISR